MEMLLNDYLRRPPKDGEYACELEIEFNWDTVNIEEHEFLSDNWIQAHDGSLRNGCEFVMRGPVSYKELRGNLEELQEFLDDYIWEGEPFTNHIVWSNRCSTHVHMNVQKLSPRQLMLFACVWYMFEPIIVDKFAPDRAGNLFCLRAVDAPAYLDYISRNFNPQSLRFFDDNRRYMGLNWASLIKFGSLEFRYLNGSVDPDYICSFVSFVHSLKEWVLSYDKEPRALIREASVRGLKNLYEECFKTSGEGIDFNSREIWSSVRLAQDLCYEIDLEPFNKFINNDIMEEVFIVDPWFEDEGEF